MRSGKFDSRKAVNGYMGRDWVDLIDRNKENRKRTSDHGKVRKLENGTNPVDTHVEMSLSNGYTRWLEVIIE